MGEGVPFPAGAAHIIKEGDIPLSDSDGEGTQKQRQPSSQAAAAAAARHPDEELEAELAEQQQQQEQQEVDSDWEPEAGVDSDGEGGVGGSGAVRALSPPPVSAAELASGELEVVSADEDRRMIELLRQQVGVGGVLCYVQNAACVHAVLYHRVVVALGV